MTKAEKADYDRAYYRANVDRRTVQVAAWKAAHPAHRTYVEHKASAGQRGIEWLFTLESWLTFWGAKLVLRGKAATDLCCARKGDVGPYSPTNCDLITNSENVRYGLAKRWSRN